MPLIPQQDIVYVEGPYGGREPLSFETAFAELKRRLESYPSIRIVSLQHGFKLSGHYLTAVVETV